MKWINPRIEVENFVANEYVAACGESGVNYYFECDAGTKYTHYAIKDSDGNIATINDVYWEGFGNYYTSCFTTHTAPTTNEFLSGYHLDDRSTTQDENIPVIIWTEGGKDIHATTNLVQSSWEKDKS